ncbi:MAG: DUF3667 domain-containing protein [Planctomycetota bacterium]
MTHTSKSSKRPGQCPNCETALAADAKYCNACGQKVGPLEVRVRDLLGDAFKNLFQYDGKFLRTMRTLLFRPGRLSRDYIEGRRVRYLTPVALFMLIAGLMFLLIESTASQPVEESAIRSNASGNKTVNLMPGFVLTFPFDKLEEIKRDDKAIEIYLTELGLEKGTWKYYFSERCLHSMQREGIAAFRKQMVRVTYRAIALLIPMLAAWVLLFHRKQKLYFAHAAVYCLHLHCIFFLGFGLLLILPSAWYRDLLIPPLALVFVIYTAMSLKTTFDNTWLLAIVKSICILLLHGFVTLMLTALLSLWVIASL